MTTPYISVVIPVHNEEASLENLYNRLIPVLDGMGKPFEVILTNDASTDNSANILNSFFERRPDNIRIIHFNRNYGQHLAIMAGFERVRGEIVVTMDADLQNLPEDIPKLVEKMEEGHDVVGGYRQNRKDLLWRKWVSKMHNWVRAQIMPGMEMKDQGCMLRAYRKDIVDLMVQSDESNTYIPALALNYAAKPAEVPVSHDPRMAGESNYNLYKLIRYNFDLVTNFSLAPLQIFTLIGILVSCLSGVLVFYLLARRLFIGPEAEGIFTLFALVFFLVGLCLLGLGILGEYIGRIYQEVRKRPRFVIKNIVEKKDLL